MTKVDKKNIEDIMSLTPMQEGILFHHLKAPEKTLYFEQLCLQISGSIDITPFETAWSHVIENNEMLRTAFRWEKIEKPVQVILKNHRLQLEYYDLPGNEDEKEKDKVNEKLLAEIKERDKKAGFDLTRVPFRVTLCKLGQDKYEMIISNHHILYDGWSNGIILEEFFNTYHALIPTRHQALKRQEKSKFKEYIHWLRHQDVQRQEKFWKNYLSEIDTAAEMEISIKKSSREEIKTIGDLKVKLKKELWVKLEKCINKLKITAASLFYTAYGLLLQKYNNSNDMIFGTTVSGRSAKIKSIENMVGLFINTLPLRVQSHSHEKIENLLQKINEALQTREAYETTPLVDIKQYSQLYSSEELFDSIVVIENYPLDIRGIREKGQLTIDSYSMFEMTNYDLTVTISLTGEIEINFIYNDELFTYEIIERLSGHYFNILREMGENPARQVSRVDILSIQEREQILKTFNNTSRDYPGGKSLYQLFEEHVERIPDKTALVGGSSKFHISSYKQEETARLALVSISYRELHEQSNRLAYRLRQQGVSGNRLVGLMVDRSVEMVIGLYGILKQGSAYLPVAPEYPEERIRYMLEDSSSQWLISQKKHIASTGFKGNTIDIESDSLSFAFSPGRDTDTYEPTLNNNPENLIYVIYTSGSTGKPKGVPIKARGFINLVWWYITQLEIKTTDKFLVISPISFDLTEKDLFAPLITGASLHLAPPGFMEYEDLSQFITRERHTVINCAPSVFYPFVEFNRDTDFERLKSLRYLILGGEPIQMDKMLPWLSSGMCSCEIYNTYGPTECTDTVSYYRLEKEITLLDQASIIPIGKPVNNMMLLILNRNQHLQPLGVVGEVCIAGIGTGPGYCNNVEFTAEKFIRLPHLHLSPGRIYRSGDLGRWLSDGNIEFLGRSDHQVKIRGLRIELEEIESLLLKNPGIKEAVVDVKENLQKDKSICAYIVTLDKISVASLRDFLSTGLPAYMIPSHFVMLDHIPLTPSGKINRKALPAPEIKIDDNIVAPRDVIEKRLAVIWSEVLEQGPERISIDDNFFQSGGHSLKAAVLVSRIHRELDINIPLSEIFKTSTSHIRGLAAYIKESTRSGQERYISIEAIEKKEYYPLSSAQARLYILQQMDKQGIVYNIPSFWKMEGNLDTIKMIACFHELIRCHESLRTSFHLLDDEPVQRIYEPGEIEFSSEYYELNKVEVEKEQSSKETKVHHSFVRPFDLSQAPLFRVGLIKNAEEQYTLMVDMHHIISDGISVGVLIDDFIKSYQDESILAQRIYYKDYVDWQQHRKQKEKIAQQEAYWLKQWTDEIPVLNLPTDYSRPLHQDFSGHTLSFRLEEKTDAEIKSLSREQDVTLFMLLLCIYFTFLSKLTGQEDIVVGTPTAGRQHAEAEKIIGMFVNTLVLRNFPSRHKSFSQLLTEVKAHCLASFENQDYPFEELVEQVAVERDTSRNPLFDTMFALQNMETAAIQIPNLKIAPVEHESCTAKFDLTLIAVETDEELSFVFEYGKKLFKETTIKRFVHYFKNTLAAVITDKHIKPGEIEIITGEEKQQILYDFNDTTTNYCNEKNLHRLFAEQVERTPDKIALVGKSTKLQIPNSKQKGTGGLASLNISYRELHEQSHQLADLLHDKGVKPDTIVGLMVERSIEMITGILAIINAGGTYLPIDPDYPQDRIQYMLKDSGAKILLTGQEIAGISSPQVFNNRPKGTNSINNYQLTINNLQLKGNNLAYIIYTSGSTGKPKGVLVQHSSLINFVYAFSRYIGGFGPTDHCLCITNFTFDVSVGEIFVPLLFGSVLFILPRQKVYDVRGLCGEILEKCITFAYIHPHLLKDVSRHLEESGVRVALNKMLVGVEPIKDYVLEGFFNINESMRVINGYGPTEATICATFYRYLSCRPVGRNVPIGNPLDNTMILLLDKALHLVPINVPGELCIGGHGLARGYLNRVELTAEKFSLEACKNPMQSCSHAAMPSLHHPIYRTGDLARWLPEGNIEFLGRLDFQVKVRGFRIELGEIEAHLLDHPHVKEAVVITREEKENDKYLCAYIRLSESEAVPIESTAWRDYLSNLVPDYMIPSYFMQLERIPITSSGKIDRKALPAPEIKIGDKFVAPRDEIEKRLAVIWSQVLGVDKEKICIDDHFFKSGGHSLRASVLVSRIHRELDVNIPLSEIFKPSTSHIRGLAAYIKESTGQEKFYSIESIEKKEYHPLSSAQARLYILQQMDKQGIGYNIPSVWQVEGKVNPDKFKKGFQQLIHHHESLRTSFHILNDEPVQQIHNKLKFEIEYYWAERKAPCSRRCSSTIKEFIRPFDLTQAPLFRVGLIKIEQEQHILMVDMHHIISDGISVGVLIKNFIKTDQGESHSPQRIYYKDFARWQRQGKQKEKMSRQEAYWLKQWTNEKPVLNLPTDYSRPSIQDFSGHALSFELEEKTVAALKSLAHEQDVTFFMLLLCAYTTFLYKLSDQEDIVVGTPGAGRQHADVQNIIGMFINTLVLRNFPRRQKTFDRLLAEVKVRSLEAFENQDYPFEDLVEKVDVERDTSRNPLFDTMFALQNMDTAAIEIPGLKIAPVEYDSRTAKFDLTLTAIETGEKLSFVFEYSTKLFKKTTIKRFVQYFKNTLAAVIAHKRVKLGEIEIITAEEKKQLLYDFNDTLADYPREKRIHQLFTQQAKRTPDAAALIGGSCGDDLINKNRNITITYRELNHRADRLAYRLRRQGVSGNRVVGLMVDRSVEMVIGLYGILKQGSAYLPVAPDYPGERIRYMLEDSSIQWLVIQKKYIASTGFKGNTIDIESDSLSFAFSPGEVLDTDEPILNNNLENLIYVIYTSGSTGKPKGVPIKAMGVVNLVWWYKNQLEIKTADKFLVISPISFDLTQKDLFAPLITGGSLHLAPPGFIEYEDLSRFITRERHTVINCAPSVFYPFVEFNRDNGFERLKPLRYLILGGEPIQMGKMLPWLSSGMCNCEIYNTYGPTECTDTVSYYRLEKEITLLDQASMIPIGKPVNNMMLLILNRSQHLQPLGVVGEVCIAGIGTGPGYCNNVEFTAEKFIRLPHLHLSSGRIYRSGDLGRWLTDGNIEFLGRSDHQVKIRGLRIELEEIENLLLKYPGIKEAVVAVKENRQNDKYICAYIVTDSKATSPTTLRDFLSTGLPAYMIPSHFVILDYIPLAPSGKINRKALPAPDIKINDNFVAPRDEIEKRLAVIWSGVLGQDRYKISIEDNFFQSGGHSLQAAVLVSRIHREFDVNIPLSEIFKPSTSHIRGLAAYIKESTGQEKFYSIASIEEKEYYPLSSAQARLYILQQMDKQGIGYNIPSVWQVEGSLSVERLTNIFHQLIHRHESLRTSFQLLDDEPVQRIHEQVEFEIEYDQSLVNRQGRDEAPTPIRVEKIIRDFIRPFDLSRPPLLRVGLVKPEEEKHILILDIHHIISDGTSMGVLLKEFKSLYSKEKLPQLIIQYKDFTGWQNRKKVKGSIKQQESYWLKSFEEKIPVLDLPADYPRPVVQSFEGSAVDFVLNKEESNDLKQLAAGEESTLFVVLFSIFNILLSKLSGQEDIVTGTPIAGRRHADIEYIIGMFVNTLALRNYPSGEKSFKEFLKHVKKITLNAFENQDYQFEDLVEKVEVKRDISRNPLFDVMFTSQNIMTPTGIQETPEEKMEEIKVKPYSYKSRTSKFDLTLTNTKIKEILHFQFQYCTKLFREETIHAFIRYFKQIISTVVKLPGKKISEIEIIKGQEKQQILFDFNHTEGEYPGDKTIHQLFEDQAERTPGKISVVFEDKKLTYKELDAKTRQLAWRLREKGVIPDAIVGIMVPPGLEMPSGVLAVLKAGGGYLPIDPEYPGRRINYILDDSNCKLLLLQKHLQYGIKFNGEVINVQDPGIYSYPGEDTNPDNISNSKSIAYTIYTSGTTGKPKGVLVKHESLTNYVNWFTKKTLLTGEDKTILTSSFAFDLGYTSVFPSILNGGELHLLPKETYLSADGFLNYIKENNISYLKVTPSFLSVVVNDAGFSQEMCRRLRLAVVGGEAINLKDIKKVHGICRNIKIMNHYGPTEATIGCIARYIDFNRFAAYEKHPTIGTPIDNGKVYILDRNLKLLPVGIAGELCISGICLARGYLNQPELTARKFVGEVTGALTHSDSYKRFAQHIGSPRRGAPGRPRQNLYKTGDKAKWMPDGTVEFLGRIDNQVKIRGYRIELGEIESQLLDHEEIREVVIVPGKDGKGSGEKYLCAYLVSDREQTVSELRQYLLNEFSEYMVPSYFIHLDRFPLTPNGKIDLDALPLPLPQGIIGSKYAKPRNKIEEILSRIWSEVLEYSASEIGIDDNFFERGGHSLKVIKMLNMIHKVFHIKIPLTEIFKHPTIREISHLVSQMGKYRYTSIEPTAKKEFHPLSFAQKRLYFLWKMDSASTRYNLPGAMIIEGKLNRKLFEGALRALISRHQILRTSFHLVNRKPVQEIHEKVEFEIEYNDAAPKRKNQGHKKELAVPGAESIASLIKNFIRPFDLTYAPLLRVGLKEIEQDRYLLLLDKHHIISDGVTEVILIRELIQLYEGKTLGELPLQYKDYSEWQNKKLKTGEINRQKEYWLNRFNGNIPILNMHTDYQRQDVPIFHGDRIPGEIGPGLTRKIKDLTRETETTLFMVLLAAWYILLSKYTNQEDITAGIPTAGRSHPDLEHIAGMFVNTLAMRNYPAKERDFADFLQEVKTNSLEDYKNQDYPFDDLVHQLNMPRISQRNPLFDVLFVSEDLDMPELAIKGLRFCPYSFEHPITHMDLVLYFTLRQETIQLILEYSTSLFKEETVKRMLDHYTEILKQVLENRTIAIKDITISHEFLIARPSILQEEDVEFTF